MERFSDKLQMTEGTTRWCCETQTRSSALLRHCSPQNKNVLIICHQVIVVFRWTITFTHYTTSFIVSCLCNPWYHCKFSCWWSLAHLLQDWQCVLFPTKYYIIPMCVHMYVYRYACVCIWFSFISQFHFTFKGIVHAKFTLYKLR